LPDACVPYVIYRPRHDRQWSPLLEFGIGWEIEFIWRKKVL